MHETLGVGQVLEASRGHASLPGSMGAMGTLGLPWPVCAQIPLELTCSRLLHAYKTQTGIFKDLDGWLPDEAKAADSGCNNYWPQQMLRV